MTALKETKATSASVALVADGKTVWSQTFGRVNNAGKKPSPTTKYGVGSGQQDGHGDRGDAVGGPRQDLARCPGGALRARLLDAVAAVQADHRTDAAQPLRRIARHRLRRRRQQQADTRLRRRRDGRAAQLPLEDHSGRDERLLQRLLHLGRRGGGAGLGHAFPGLRGRERLRAAGDEALDLSESGSGAGERTRRSSRAARRSRSQVTNIWASGGLLSTSDDMARLAMVFTGDGVVGGKRILSSSAIQQMAVDQTTTTLRAGSPGAFRYGLGWDSMADPALKSAGVRGWTKGGDIGPVPRRVHGRS